MKTASVKEIREELSYRSDKELIAIVLRLSRFKKENKELLHFLLFESHDTDGYIQQINAVMDQAFLEINTANNYRMKKAVRKILREAKKYIRYTGNKEVEVAVLIHWCKLMRETHRQILKSKVMSDILARQVILIKTRISTLHEDLQHDFEQELNMVEL